MSTMALQPHDIRGHFPVDIMEHSAEEIIDSFQSGHQVDQPSADFVANVLSATTYPNVMDASKPSRRTSKRKAQEVPAFGGYSFDGIPSAQDDPPKGKPASQKRTRVHAVSEAMDIHPDLDADANFHVSFSENFSLTAIYMVRRSVGNTDDENSRKQRGRPRLDTHDETAADRRRTQIRLAQRAYRHRKETTIFALKHRVKDLEQTIAKMNSSFLNLQDNMFDSGMLHARPALSDQLKNTADEFLTLSKLTPLDSDGDEEAANIAEIERSHTLTESPHQAEHMEVDEQQYVPRDSRLSHRGPGLPIKQRGNSNFGTLEELPMFTDADFNLVPANKSGESILDEWSFVSDFQKMNTLVPDPVFSNDQMLIPEIERPLKTSLPYTYSFQETTFARRLHRLTLERAFRALTNPATDPEYIARSFRFTFTFSNKARMLSRFQELLKRKAGESLENWNVPYFRIGGAGTHFPRRDDAGRKVYPPNMFSPAKAFGPMPFVLAERPRNETTVEELVEAVGFGGVWFDSHDVEEYLRTKGIFLDGSSSFVEVDPSSLNAPPLLLSSSSTNSIMDSSSTQGRSPPTPELADKLRNTLDYFAQELPDPFGLDDFPTFGGKVIDDGNVAAPNWNHGAVTPPTRAQAPMTLDVSKLLERIVAGSACLGRAPGFRQKDIDNALKAALREAF